MDSSSDMKIQFRILLFFSLLNTGPPHFVTTFLTTVHRPAFQYDATTSPASNFYLYEKTKKSIQHNLQVQNAYKGVIKKCVLLHYFNLRSFLFCSYETVKSNYKIFFLDKNKKDSENILYGGLIWKWSHLIM